MNQIEKTITRSPITVKKVYKSDYQKEKSLTAELRQEIVTTATYPTANMSNSLSDNIFSNSEFGLEGKDYTSTETRVVFINIPESLDSPEKVAAHLQKFPDLCLYKILSNKPILSNEDENAIQQGFISLDSKANSQAIRYPEGSENAGELALTKEGKVQYRRISFSTTLKEDVDLRNNVISDQYLSASIKAEIEGVIETVITKEQRLG